MKNENFSHLELLTVQQRKESEAAEAGDVYLSIIHCSKKERRECSYFERCPLSSLRVSMFWNILSLSLFPISYCALICGASALLEE